MYENIEEGKHYLYTESPDIIELHVRCYRASYNRPMWKFLFDIMEDQPPLVQKGYSLCVTTNPEGNYNYCWTIRPVKEKQ